MKNLNILVTGGAGYVGSVLIPSLIEDDHNVKCLDRFFFGNKFFNLLITFMQPSLTSCGVIIIILLIYSTFS